MPRGGKGCVFVDAKNTEAAVQQWSGLSVEGLVAEFVVVPVVNGPALARTVRQSVRSGSFNVFVNACAGCREDEEAASSLDVALLLQDLNVPYTGCRPRYLGHTVNDVNMMSHYADIKCPTFTLMKSTEDVEKACSALKFPVRVRSNRPAQVGVEGASSGDTPLPDAAALRTFAAAAFNEYSELIAREVSTEASTEEYYILATKTVSGTIKMVGPYAHSDRSIMKNDNPLYAKFEHASTKVIETMLGGCGYALLHMQAVGEGDDRHIEMLDMQANCAVNVRWFTEESYTFGQFAAELVEVAFEKFDKARPTFVVSFDPAMKGYFMRAAKDLKKDDIVFHDECRNFPIVTKGHVEKFFSEEDKVTFSEYGWPLDSDGHVYAIWEDDPRTWRPINHSCDPNLIFAEKCSLNVIASRDIKRGEDLTMDYATFCDFTMKPFQCFCGATCCRGMIKPDAESLAKYNVHAWHRRQPHTL